MSDDMPVVTAPETRPFLKPATYDLFKQIVQIILPGVGALYFTLSSIWGLPYAEQIVGTLAAVAVFLGLILNLSKRSYEASDSVYDGKIVIDTTTDVDDEGKLYDKKVANLVLNEDPEDIVQHISSKRKLTFKVSE